MGQMSAAHRPKARIATILVRGCCRSLAVPCNIIVAPFGARHPSGPRQRALPPVPADAAKTV